MRADVLSSCKENSIYTAPQAAIDEPIRRAEVYAREIAVWLGRIAVRAEEITVQSEGIAV
jgi:hypothetical protein